MSDEWAGYFSWSIRVTVHKFKTSSGVRYMNILIGHKEIAKLIWQENTWYWGAEKVGTDEYKVTEEVIKRLGYSE